MTTGPTPPSAAAEPDRRSPLARRLVLSTGLVLVLAFPAIVAGLVWSSDAAGPMILGALVGAVSAMTAGQRIAILQAFLLALAAPVVVVAGQVPVSGAAIMALLCIGAGLTALWGMHSSFTLLPLVLAYPLINPPQLGSIPVDRNSATYIVTLSLLMTVGALWMALVVPVAARHRELLPLHPASRRDALTYTVLITVLCSVNTYAVLAIRPGSQGAWLILTLIAVTQMGPLKSVSKTVYRVVGTVLGTLVAAGIAAVVPEHGIQVLLALLSLVLAMVFRSGARYWLYVTFLTPTVLLLSATGDVAQTGEYRVAYTVIAASQVILASAIVLVYQHLRSTGRAQPRELRAEPLTAVGATDA